MVTRPARERGVTFLALLLAIALVSSVLAASASVWSQAQRREREKQLLWAGDQFRRALAAYARAGNGTYPRTLEDLLEDTRSPARRRFLRQIYEDPMTRGAEWGLIRNPAGGIVGVFSRFEGAPIKKGQFPEQYGSFEGAKTYAGWKFAAVTLPTATPEPGSQSDPGGFDPARRPLADAPPPDAANPAAPPGAPEPAAAAHRPLAIPRSAVIESTQPRPGVFGPSPLTPLQTLRSPYAPAGAPATVAPSAPSATSKAAAPSDTQSRVSVPEVPPVSSPASTQPAPDKASEGTPTTIEPSP